MEKAVLLFELPSLVFILQSVNVLLLCSVKQRTIYVLQTTNFALNFVLYSVVNIHFRETWKKLFFFLFVRVA